MSDNAATEVVFALPPRRIVTSIHVRPASTVLIHRDRQRSHGGLDRGVGRLVAVTAR